VSLADALERAAEALPWLADAIRPANGDPERLLETLAPDDATALLTWLLAEDAAAAEELALAFADSPRGAEPLSRVDAGSLGKAGRKALRRAQHRLRSRGVAVADVPPPARVATLPELGDELAGALVSAPDRSGAQLALIVEAHPTGGARIFQAAVDLERGILEFQVLSATRSQARRLLREMTANAALAAVSAPRDAVAALLARAAEAQPPDRALPPAFEEWRSQVARPAAGTRTPGDLVRAALPEPADLGRAREVAARVAAGELGPWPPPLEQLRALAEKVRQISESSLLVSDDQRRAQTEGAIGDALEARYEAAARERTAQRLEEGAYVAWRRGREPEARALLATATVFRERSPRDNPAARALLDRVLGPMLEALRDERASSLLVRP
jgi:hypothetical protein